jgi:7-carboxy-7-deazaguanine synthase
MLISEIFYSLQGEGFLAGVPSIFVRFAGCPLNCRWCDTKYARDAGAGTELSLEEVTKSIGQWRCSNLVITGGEPLVDFNDSRLEAIRQLIEQFKADYENSHVTIETAGIAYVPDLDCDLMSISPKLSNSLAEPDRNHVPVDVAVLRELIGHYEYQLKFVVEDENDIAQINELIEKIVSVDISKVMLMPQARTRVEFIERAPTVAKLCLKSGFAFSQRLHILLWDNQRAT